MNQQRIIFINSHPIQYYAPLYQAMHEKKIDIEVWYCDDASIKGKIDKGFGKEVKWDIPILSGYAYRFFKNQAFKKEVSGSFLGVVNFNLLFTLLKTSKSIVVINGWQFFTYFFALFFAKMRGHKVWYRIETPIQQIKNIGKIKHFILKNIVFKLVDKFLYIGKDNRKFYEHFNISSERLLFAPYAVDNNRFKADFELHKNSSEVIKKELQIPLDKKIILFSGKLIWQKNPLHLLKAFMQLPETKYFLIFLGDGPLRNEVEQAIQKNNVKNVTITGFINQGSIGKYYSIADLFVLCSVSETWGLSVNEVMCFQKPVLVSTACGCANDLVQDGVNGYKLNPEDVNDLKNKIEQVFTNLDMMQNGGKMSGKIIEGYSYDITINNILQQI